MISPRNGSRPTSDTTSPPKSVDFLVAILGREIDACLRLEILKIEAGIRFVASSRQSTQAWRIVDIMLVIDVAHDFFDQILDRDETVRTTIFVDHKCQMHVTGLHLHQEIAGRHGWRHEQNFALDLCGSDIGPAHGAVGIELQLRQRILDVHKPRRIVQGLAINGQARMLCFAIIRHQLAELGALFDRDDIGPRHHHVGQLSARRI